MIAVEVVFLRFFGGGGVKYKFVHPTSASRLRNGLKSVSSSDYTLPRLHTKFAERAFSHAGPAAWNVLPENIRANQDCEVFFRKQLITYFAS